MDGLVVNRPLLALGLVAASVLLLSSLFADVRQEIEDPTQWQPDPDLLEAGAEAVNTVGQTGAGQKALGGNADLLRLLEGGQLRLPAGTEFDGDLLRLMEGVAWTLPAGTELEDLALPLPEGIGVDVPPGTTIDGDTLVFPPGSTLTLDDGTTLELPEGGRLTLPGMTNAELQQALRDGHVTTTEGSTFTAPRVTSNDEWPMVFPAGTEFRLPEGWTPPSGWRFNGDELARDVDWEIPAGTEAAPQGFETQSTKAGSTSPSLFERIGDFSLGDGAKAPSAGGLGGLGGLGGAPWLVWVLVGAGVLVAAYLLWRFRDRLLPNRAVAAGGATRAPRLPVRAVLALDERPAGLPLAAAPGDAPRLALRLESETFDVVPGDDTESKPRRVRRFEPTSGRVTLTLDGRHLVDLDVPTEGTALPLAVLQSGDHRLRLEVRVPTQRRPVVLDEVLRVAPWPEQVARDYQTLYETAGRALNLPDGFTPRTLEKALQGRIGKGETGRLDHMITLFERANYSQSDIDRADWLRFVVAAQAYAKVLAPRTERNPPQVAGAAKTGA